MDLFGFAELTGDTYDLPTSSTAASSNVASNSGTTNNNEKQALTHRRDENECVVPILSEKSGPTKFKVLARLKAEEDEVKKPPVVVNNQPLHTAEKIKNETVKIAKEENSRKVSDHKDHQKQEKGKSDHVKTVRVQDKARKEIKKVADHTDPQKEAKQRSDIVKLVSCANDKVKPVSHTSKEKDSDHLNLSKMCKVKVKHKPKLSAESKGTDGEVSKKIQKERTKSSQEIKEKESQNQKTVIKKAKSSSIKDSKTKESTNMQKSVRTETQQAEQSTTTDIVEKPIELDQDKESPKKTEIDSKPPSSSSECEDSKLDSKDTLAEKSEEMDITEADASQSDDTSVSNLCDNSLKESAQPLNKCFVSLERCLSSEDVNKASTDHAETSVTSMIQKRKLSIENEVMAEILANVSRQDSDSGSSMSDLSYQGNVKRKKSSDERVAMVYDTNIDVRKSGRLKSAKCASRYRGDYGIRADIYNKLACRKNDSDTENNSSINSDASEKCNQIKKEPVENQFSEAVISEQRTNENEMESDSFKTESNQSNPNFVSDNIPTTSRIETISENQSSVTHSSGILEQNIQVPCSPVTLNSSCTSNCDCPVNDLRSDISSENGDDREMCSRNVDLIQQSVSENNCSSVLGKTGYVHSVGKSVNKKQKYITKRSVDNEMEIFMPLSPDSSPEKGDPSEVLENLRNKMFKDVGLSAEWDDAKPKLFESKLISSRLKKKVSHGHCINSRSPLHNSTDRYSPRCSTPNSASGSVNILEEVAEKLDSMQKAKRKNEGKESKPKRQRFQDKKFMLRSLSRSSDKFYKLDIGESSVSLYEEETTDSDLISNASDCTKDTDMGPDDISFNDSQRTIHSTTEKDTVSDSKRTKSKKDSVKAKDKSVECEKKANIVKPKPKSVKCPACCQTFRSKEIMRKHFPCRVRQTRTWSQNKLRPNRVFRNDTFSKNRTNINSRFSKSGKQNVKPRPQLLTPRKTKFRRVKGKRRRRLRQLLQDLMNKRKIIDWPHLNVLYTNLSFKEQSLYRLGLICVGDKSKGLDRYSKEDLKVFEEHQAKEKEFYSTRDFKHIFPSSDDESRDSIDDSKDPINDSRNPISDLKEVCDSTDNVPSANDTTDLNDSIQSYVEEPLIQDTSSGKDSQLADVWCNNLSSATCELSQDGNEMSLDIDTAMIKTERSMQKPGLDNVDDVQSIVEDILHTVVSTASTSIKPTKGQHIPHAEANLPLTTRATIEMNKEGFRSQHQASNENDMSSQSKTAINNLTEKQTEQSTLSPEAEEVNSEISSELVKSANNSEENVCDEQSSPEAKKLNSEIASELVVSVNENERDDLPIQSPQAKEFSSECTVELNESAIKENNHSASDIISNKPDIKEDWVEISIPSLKQGNLEKSTKVLEVSHLKGMNKHFPSINLDHLPMHADIGNTIVSNKEEFDNESPKTWFKTASESNLTGPESNFIESETINIPRRDLSASITAKESVESVDENYISFDVDNEQAGNADTILNTLIVEDAPPITDKAVTTKPTEYCDENTTHLENIEKDNQYFQENETIDQCNESFNASSTTDSQSLTSSPEIAAHDFIEKFFAISEKIEAYMHCSDTKDRQAVDDESFQRDISSSPIHREGNSLNLSENLDEDSSNTEGTSEDNIDKLFELSEKLEAIIHDSAERQTKTDVENSNLPHTTRDDPQKEYFPSAKDIESDYEDPYSPTFSPTYSDDSSDEDDKSVELEPDDDYASMIDSDFKMMLNKGKIEATYSSYKTTPVKIDVSDVDKKSPTEDQTSKSLDYVEKKTIYEQESLQAHNDPCFHEMKTNNLVVVNSSVCNEAESLCVPAPVTAISSNIKDICGEHIIPESSKILDKKDTNEEVPYILESSKDLDKQEAKEEIPCVNSVPETYDSNIVKEVDGIQASEEVSNEAISRDDSEFAESIQNYDTTISTEEKIINDDKEKNVNNDEKTKDFDECHGKSPNTKDQSEILSDIDISIDDSKEENGESQHGTTMSSSPNRSPFSPKTPAVIKYKINGVYFSENLETGVKEVITDEYCETDIKIDNIQESSSEISKDEDVFSINNSQTEQTVELEESDPESGVAHVEISDTHNNERQISTTKIDVGSTNQEDLEFINRDNEIGSCVMKQDSMPLVEDKGLKDNISNLNKSESKEYSLISQFNAEHISSKDSEVVSIVSLDFVVEEDKENIKKVMPSPQSEEIETTRSDLDTHNSHEITDISVIEVMDSDSSSDTCEKAEVLFEKLEVKTDVQPIEPPPLLEKAVEAKTTLEVTEESIEVIEISEAGPPVLEPVKKTRVERHFLDVLGEICENKTETDSRKPVERKNIPLNTSLQPIVVLDDIMKKGTKDTTVTDMPNGIDNVQSIDLPTETYKEDLGRHFSDVIDASCSEKTKYSQMQMLLDESEKGDVTLAQIKSLLSPTSKKGIEIPKDSLLRIRTGVENIVAKVKIPTKKDPAWLKRDALLNYSTRDDAEDRYENTSSNSDKENECVPSKECTYNNQYCSQVSANGSFNDSSSGSITDNILQMLTSLEDKGSFAENMTNLLHILAENLGFSHNNTDSNDENVHIKDLDTSTNSNKLLALDDFESQMQELGGEPPCLDDISFDDSFSQLEEVNDKPEIENEITKSEIVYENTDCSSQRVEVNEDIDDEAGDDITQMAEVNDQNGSEKIEIENETKDNLSQVELNEDDEKVTIENETEDSIILIEKVKGQDVSEKCEIENDKLLINPSTKDNDLCDGGRLILESGGIGHNHSENDRVEDKTEQTNKQSSKVQSLFKRITELNSIETDDDSEAEETFDVAAMSQRMSELKSISKDVVESDANSDVFSDNESLIADDFSITSGDKNQKEVINHVEHYIPDEVRTEDGVSLTSPPTLSPIHRDNDCVDLHIESDEELPDIDRTSDSPVYFAKKLEDYELENYKCDSRIKEKITGSPCLESNSQNVFTDGENGTTNVNASNCNQVDQPEMPQLCFRDSQSVIISENNDDHDLAVEPANNNEEIETIESKSEDLEKDSLIVNLNENKDLDTNLGGIKEEQEDILDTSKSTERYELDETDDDEISENESLVNQDLTVNKKENKNFENDSNKINEEQNVLDTSQSTERYEFDDEKTDNESLANEDSSGARDVSNTSEKFLPGESQEDRKELPADQFDDEATDRELSDSEHSETENESVDYADSLVKHDMIISVNNDIDVEHDQQNTEEGKDVVVKDSFEDSDNGCEIKELRINRRNTENTGDEKILLENMMSSIHAKLQEISSKDGHEDKNNSDNADLLGKHNSNRAKENTATENQNFNESQEEDTYITLSDDDDEIVESDSIKERESNFEDHEDNGKINDSALIKLVDNDIDNLKKDQQNTEEGKDVAFKDSLEDSDNGCEVKELRINRRKSENTGDEKIWLENMMSSIHAKLQEISGKDGHENKNNSDNADLLAKHNSNRAEENTATEKQNFNESQEEDAYSTFSDEDYDTIDNVESDSDHSIIEQETNHEGNEKVLESDAAISKLGDNSIDRPEQDQNNTDEGRDVSMEDSDTDYEVSESEIARNTEHTGHERAILENMQNGIKEMLRQLSNAGGSNDQEDDDGLIRDTEEDQDILCFHKITDTIEQNSVKETETHKMAKIEGENCSVPLKSFSAKNLNSSNTELVNGFGIQYDTSIIDEHLVEKQVVLACNQKTEGNEHHSINETSTIERGIGKADETDESRTESESDVCPDDDQMPENHKTVSEMYDHDSNNDKLDLNKDSHADIESRDEDISTGLPTNEYNVNQIDSHRHPKVEDTEPASEIDDTCQKENVNIEEKGDMNSDEITTEIKSDPNLKSGNSSDKIDAGYDDLEVMPYENTPGGEESLNKDGGLKEKVEGIYESEQEVIASKIDKPKDSPKGISPDEKNEDIENELEVNCLEKEIATMGNSTVTLATTLTNLSNESLNGPTLMSQNELSKSSEKSNVMCMDEDSSHTVVYENGDTNTSRINGIQSNVDTGPGLTDNNETDFWNLGFCETIAERAKRKQKERLIKMDQARNKYRSLFTQENSSTERQKEFSVFRKTMLQTKADRSKKRSLTIDDNKKENTKRPRSTSVPKDLLISECTVVLNEITEKKTTKPIDIKPCCVVLKKLDKETVERYTDKVKDLPEIDIERPPIRFKISLKNLCVKPCSPRPYVSDAASGHSSGVEESESEYSDNVSENGSVCTENNEWMASENYKVYEIKNSPRAFHRTLEEGRPIKIRVKSVTAHHSEDGSKEIVTETLNDKTNRSLFSAFDDVILKKLPSPLNEISDAHKVDALKSPVKAAWIKDLKLSDSESTDIETDHGETETNECRKSQTEDQNKTVTKTDTVEPNKDENIPNSAKLQDQVNKDEVMHNEDTGMKMDEVVQEESNVKKSPCGSICLEESPLSPCSSTGILENETLGKSPMDKKCHVDESIFPDDLCDKVSLESELNILSENNESLSEDICENEVDSDNDEESINSQVENIIQNLSSPRNELNDSDKQCAQDSPVQEETVITETENPNDSEIENSKETATEIKRSQDKFSIKDLDQLETMFDLNATPSESKDINNVDCLNKHSSEDKLSIPEDILLDTSQLENLDSLTNSDDGDLFHKKSTSANKSSGESNTELPENSPKESEAIEEDSVSCDDQCNEVSIESDMNVQDENCEIDGTLQAKKSINDEPSTTDSENSQTIKNDAGIQETESISDTKFTKTEVEDLHSDVHISQESDNTKIEHNEDISNVTNLENESSLNSPAKDDDFLEELGKISEHDNLSSQTKVGSVVNTTISQGETENVHVSRNVTEEENIAEDLNHYVSYDDTASREENNDPENTQVSEVKTDIAEDVHCKVNIDNTEDQDHKNDVDGNSAALDENKDLENTLVSELKDCTEDLLHEVNIDNTAVLGHNNDADSDPAYDMNEEENTAENAHFVHKLDNTSIAKDHNDLENARVIEVKEVDHTQGEDTPSDVNIHNSTAQGDNKTENSVVSEPKEVDDVAEDVHYEVNLDNSAALEDINNFGNECVSELNEVETVTEALDHKKACSETEMTDENNFIVTEQNEIPNEEAKTLPEEDITMEEESCAMDIYDSEREKDMAVLSPEGESFQKSLIPDIAVEEGDEIIYYAVEVNEDFETDQAVASIEGLNEEIIIPNCEHDAVLETCEVQTNMVESMAVEGYEIQESAVCENMLGLSDANEIVGPEEIIPGNEVEACSSEMTDISCVAVVESQNRFLCGINEDSQSSQELIEECVMDFDEVQLQEDL